MTAEILFKRTPASEWEIAWVKTGKKREILASAQSLLRSLREDEGCPRAKVQVRFESGRKISVRYRGSNA